MGALWTPFAAHQPVKGSPLESHPCQTLCAPTRPYRIPNGLRVKIQKYSEPGIRLYGCLLQEKQPFRASDTPTTIRPSSWPFTPLEPPRWAHSGGILEGLGVVQVCDKACGSRNLAAGATARMRSLKMGERSNIGIARSEFVAYQRFLKNRNRTVQFRWTASKLESERSTLNLRLQ